MRAQGRADTVYGILIIPGIGFKGRIHCLLQRLKTMGNRHHLCSQNLHPGNIGRLLCYIHFSHMNLALQAEKCSCRGQGHPVLACPSLCDKALLAHEFGQQSFPHTVVQLVGACVVQILPFQIYLAISNFSGQTLAVVNRSWPSLEFLADPPQFIDEL